MLGPWYLDDGKLTYVAAYKNEKEASREAQNAARNGWMPQATAATEGHVNVGRTALKVVALGLPFLITGASRTQGKITITYVRTPEWLAERQIKLAKEEEARRAKRAAGEEARRACLATQQESAARQKTAKERRELNRQALSGLRRGHVTEEQATYEQPDIFGKPSGQSLPAGTAFNVLAIQGAFAQIRSAPGGLDRWIPLDVVTPGDPKSVPESVPIQSDETGPRESVPPATGAEVPAQPLEKTCPRCAESVKFAAQVCRYCGHEFGTAATDPIGPKGEGRFCGSCGVRVGVGSPNYCASCGARISTTGR